MGRARDESSGGAFLVKPHHEEWGSVAALRDGHMGEKGKARGRANLLRGPYGEEGVIDRLRKDVRLRGKTGGKEGVGLSMPKVGVTSSAGK